MGNTMQLNEQYLNHVERQITVPSYTRNRHKKGIVHIGVGGFHRAHLAYYTHQLQTSSNSSEWGICGIGLRESDQKIAAVLKKQDFLYTLIVKHPNGKVVPEVIGSIVDFKLNIDGPEHIIEIMAAPDTKIVSLTITEGGYNFNPSTGEFNFDNPDIQHELQHPNDPITVYGFLTAALKRRRDAKQPAFTILSCDNIEHNGDMAKKMLLAFAEVQDEQLAKWIAEEVCFPNSMVDRITPVTTEADIAYLAQTYSIDDAWPVTCEPFIQWVVEDKFTNGRPDFEKVGVQFVPDVGPYEKMKLRLLNAGHSVLGILGAIHGYTTINACMEDAIFVRFLRAFLDTEATPVLGEIKGIDLKEYKDSLQERFANPNIKDSVSRICSESSAKLPKFLIPTLNDNLANKGNIGIASLILAAWCYYSDKGVNQNGQPIEIIDAMAVKLQETAQQTKNDSLSFIRITSIFGNLSVNKRFTSQYKTMLQKLYNGVAIKTIMNALL